MSDSVELDDSATWFWRNWMDKRLELIYELLGMSPG